MRGATPRASLPPTARSRFNPRPSCEGRHGPYGIGRKVGKFQSTPLMRGATPSMWKASIDGVVSIHAPHARGDFMYSLSDGKRPCFNPRPSCEGRPGTSSASWSESEFQSTPLMRGATPAVLYASSAYSCFNPRPSCEGRLVIRGRYRLHFGFNPRPSCEGRLSMTSKS